MTFTKGLFPFLAKSCLLASAVIISDEAVWRSLGFQPSCRDSAGLWSDLRRSIDGSAANIALIGSSRFHLGVDPDVLHNALPEYRFIQLSVDGSSPLPVLEDLALDQNFKGSVIVELPVFVAFQPYDPGHEQVDEFIAYRHEEGFGSIVENRLRIALEEHLAMFNPEASPWSVMGQIAAERKISKPTWNMNSRRAARRSFAGVNEQQAQEYWVKIFGDIKSREAPHETMATTKLISLWTERIQRRGGKVIFFRMNITGRLWDLEQEVWPRERYWDVFARTQCSPTLSFNDFPELAGFRCPDGSHIDARDVKRYSVAFADVLHRQGLL
jgi:hypothetical protein